MRQVQSGKGFEYAIACQLQDIAHAQLIDNRYIDTAQHYFEQCSVVEKHKMVEASKAIITFLVSHDTRIEPQKCRVRLQSDQAGGKGDVRDVIIETPSGEIGISAKNRHFGVKNPRLSDKIDFGMKWMGYRVSPTYWNEIRPLFADMRRRSQEQQLWRDLPDKEDRFYVPILHAFNAELQRIYDMDRANVPKNLLHYLIGFHDFYKVTQVNGTVVVQSFNINGTLKWGAKLPLPTTIGNREDTTKTTTIYSFDKGWQISFRIHNAESRVTPSLKFDVQIVGLPQRLSKHEIDYWHR